MALAARFAYLRGRPRREQARVLSRALLRRAGLGARGGSSPLAAPLDPPPAPESPNRRPHLRVAGILDHFSHAAFQHEFTFQSLRFECWREQLESFQPHVLLVESAWRGEGDTWRYLIADLDGPHPEFVELVSWCRQRGIPTVFWAKEDPPNYQWFIRAAAHFDQVFTVDEGSLHRYRADLGHDRTRVLPFAAQSRLHHPFAKPGVRGQYPVAFAGTYYRQKYPDRRRQMRFVLDPARKYGLHIYSRVSDSGNYRWPRRYREHLVGTLPYEEMVEAYKRYRVILNVGSVDDSATMCPRRVFEVLATATAVVSSRLQGLDQLGGDEAVARSSSRAETSRWLQELLEDDEALAHRRVQGLLRVLGDHTYRIRVDRVLESVGLNTSWVSPSATILGMLPADIPREVALATTRSWADMRGVDQVIVGGPGAKVLRGDPARSGLTVVDGGDTGDGWLRRAIETTSSTHVARLDPRHAYSETFVYEALLVAAECGPLSAIGKGAYRRYDHGVLRTVAAEREFARNVPLHTDTVVMDRVVAVREGLPLDGRHGGSDALLTRLRSNGHIVVASDRFGFLEDGAAGGQVAPSSS